MSRNKNTVPYKRIALALSLAMLILWGVLGTGASLAWFADSTPEINNIFHIADFSVELSHMVSDGTWEKVDSQTAVFDKDVLYEPGYTQVVYLKVTNTGSVPFKFYTAVNVNDRTVARNVFGQEFLLQEYLKFGITVSDSEQEMKDSLPDRAAAAAVANEPLHNYYESRAFELAPEASKYIAVVVRMPEEVGNAANYRLELPEDKLPMVELGITVKADQIPR